MDLIRSLARQSRMSRHLLIIILMLVFQSVISLASSFAPFTTEEHVDESTAIFTGKVVGSTSFKFEDGRFGTRTIIEILTTLKGVVPAYVRLIHEGGTVADEAQVDGFSPTFIPGAYYLIFAGETDGELTALQGRQSVKRLWTAASRTDEVVTWLPDSQEIVEETEEAVLTQERQGRDYRHLVVTPKEHSAAKRAAQSATPPQKAVTKSGLTEFQIPAGSPSLPTRTIAGDRNRQIPYLVDIDALPEGITEAQALAAARNAVSAWANQTSLSFVFEGVASFKQGANKISNNDGKLRLQLHDSYNQVGGITTLGIGGIFANNGSYPNGGSGGRVKGQEFHIITNSYVVLRHNQALMKNIGTFEEVLAHEIGHAIGVAHSSEASSETNETLKEALMYYQAHRDGRGATLSSYDISTVQKTYPVDNTPPVAFTHVMDIVTFPSSSTLGNPEVNQMSLLGFDRQSPASSLTVKTLTDQTSSINGTFSVNGQTLTYKPNNYSDAVRLDPKGSSFYDRFTYRIEDGVNASPIAQTRVISFSKDSSPSPVVDGLPDAWVNTYFPGGRFGGHKDDPDGEGMTNLEEYLQGTNPTQTSSAVELSFVAPSQSVSEQDRQVRVKVKTSRAVSRTVPFTYRVTGTAVKDSDYTIAVESISPHIYAGETQTELVLNLTQNDGAEASETIILTLLSVDQLVLKEPLSHVVTITDNDAPALYDFSKATFAAVEGNSSAVTQVVEVNRSGSTSAASSVDVVLSAGTTNPATLGEDIAATSVKVNFAAGQAKAVVPLSILGDLVDEPDETVVLSLTNFSSTGKLGTTHPTAVLTLTDDDDAPQVTISTITVSESVGSGVIPVQLTKASGRTITMAYSVSSLTAKAPQDYTFSNGVLTIPKGTVSASIPFTIVDDAIDEPTEEFRVTLTDLTHVAPGTVAATIAIEDNDPSPTISVLAVEGPESKSLVFTLGLSAPSARTVTVDYATQNGTAIAGFDYTAVSGTATFDPGNVTLEIPVSITNDAVDEPNETLVLLLTSPTNAQIVSASATGTIIDDDELPTLSASNVTVDESSATVTVAVQLSAASGNEVKVNYSTQAGTAKPTEDFASTAGTLTIPAGSVQGAFTIQIANDDVDEPDENFSIALSSPVSGNLGVSSILITILDDDDEPELIVNNVTVSESATTASMALLLSAPSSNVVTVRFSTANGSATAGTDYESKEGTITIPAGQTTAEIQITILNDTLDESTEDFRVQLSNPTNVSLNAATITVAITDDDDAPELRVANFSVGEGSAEAIVPLTLSAPSARAVTVTYATANGSAIAGADYESVGGTLTIPAGQTAGAIAVPILNDTLDESAEDFRILLTAPTNATLSASQVVVTITDNDAEPEIAVGNVNVDEDALEVDIAFTLSAPSTRAVTVTYATANGSATAGADYESAGGTLTIPAGQTSGAIALTILNDALDEPTEDFRLLLTAPTNATLSTAQVVVTINDNDAEPEITASEVTVSEGAPAAVIPITLTAASSRVITVNYVTANGSATASSDYKSGGGTLTIPAGQTSASIEIDLLDDQLDEPTESFQVQLSEADNASLATSAVVVTLTDNDDAPEIVFSNITTNEADGELTLSIALSAISGRKVAVNFSTLPGTALVGSDFTATSGTLEIPAGAAEGVVTIAIVNDEADEPNQQFSVVFSDPTAATLVTDTLTVTITDDDDAPQLAGTNISVGEGAAEAVASVTLNKASEQVITVSYATQEGTAKAGSDFTATNGTLTIPAGQTTASIQIPIIDDELDEGDEKFTIALSGGENVAVTSPALEVTIGDNDDPPLLEIADGQVNEGDGEHPLTLTLSKPSGRVVAIGYGLSNGSAAAGKDFVGKSGTVEFAPGETTAVVAIEILEDAVYEINETFQVSFTEANHVEFGASSIVLTIVSNDEAPVVNIADSWVGEGGSVNFAVEVVGATEVPVELQYATSDGTAKSGDYQATSGSLTLPVETPASILVATLEDDVAEDTETFLLTLSELRHGRPGKMEAVGEIHDRSGGVFIRAEEGQVNEEAGSLSIRVTVSGASKQVISFDYSTSNSSALAGEDYTSAQGRATFQPGQSELDIMVPILNDNLDESPETLQVHFSNFENAEPEVTDLVFTIVDDDPEPTLTGVSVIVSETVGQAVLQFELSAVSGRNVMFDYSTIQSTAVELQDYTPSTGTVTIEAGNTTAEIAIPILNDESSEGEEAFQIGLSKIVNATLAKESVIVTITDDDEQPALAISDAQGDEGESSVLFEIGLSAPSKLDVIVAYETRNDTATAGEDYLAANGTLTIPAGATSISLSVDLIEDALAEEDEQFLVVLSSPQNATISDEAGRGMIRDNDSVIGEEPSVQIEEVAFDYTSGDMSFMWAGTPGQTAVLESSHDLKTWVPVEASEMEGNGEAQTFTVELDDRTAYYRLRIEG